jgi:hypothetical protein
MSIPETAYGLGDIESRMGIDAITGLLAHREALVAKVSRLRARHGAFGTWESERKVCLSAAAAVIRAKAAAAGTKITEAQIEQESHVAESYVVFLTDSLSEKATCIEWENQIQSINDRINRGQAIARYLAAELGLQPR